jgi:hypothetical protein
MGNREGDVVAKVQSYGALGVEEMMAVIELGPTVHRGHGRVLGERALGSEVEGGGELRDEGGTTVGSSSTPQWFRHVEACGKVEGARQPCMVATHRARGVHCGTEPNRW